MSTGGDKKGEDKKRARERDGKDWKAGRQTRGIESSLGWTWQKRECYVGRSKLEMAVPGRRKRGRPKRRWLDNCDGGYGEGGYCEGKAVEGDEVDLT